MKNSNTSVSRKIAIMYAGVSKGYTEQRLNLLSTQTSVDLV